MDRLPRLLVACGLGLILTAPGCRSTRTEVPPRRPYSNDGRQRKPIEFSSEGHAPNGAATAVFQPDMSPNRMSGAGIGGGRDEGSTPFGSLPGPAFGAPGTSGLGEPPMPSQMPASMAPPEMMAPPASIAPPDAPAAAVAPELSIDPPAASQTIAPPLDPPGTMGLSGDLPSPH